MGDEEPQLQDSYLLSSPSRARMLRACIGAVPDASIACTFIAQHIYMFIISMCTYAVYTELTHALRVKIYRNAPHVYYAVYDIQA